MLSPCRRSSTQKARSTVKTDMSDVFPFSYPMRASHPAFLTPAILQQETSTVKMIRPNLHGRPPRKNWSVPWVWALSTAPELSAWLVQDNVTHLVSKCAVSQGSGTSATSKRECSHRAALVSDWWPGGWGGVEGHTLGHWLSRFPCSDKQSMGVLLSPTFWACTFCSPAFPGSPLPHCAGPWLKERGLSATKGQE